MIEVLTMYRNLKPVTLVFAVVVFSALGVKTVPAQSLQTVLSFNGADGSVPNSLIQAVDGNLYGTAVNGGANGPYYGTAFNLTLSGGLTTLYNFCMLTNCTDGADPSAGLVQAPNGNFYGTTAWGGNTNCGQSYGCGTIFEMNPSGQVTTLYEFCSQGGSACTDGYAPSAPLVLATNGVLYGATVYGGASFESYCLEGCGTLFKVTQQGAFTSVHTFCQADCSDGQVPVGLVQAANGALYGTTLGTFFKLTLSGDLTTLYTFTAEGPSAPIQGTDGNFYGVTSSGGDLTTNYCDNFHLGCGTVYKLSPSGKLTTLYEFCKNTACKDGANPAAALVEGSDGNFYGTTYSGRFSRRSYYGTIFQITPHGKLTTLYTFCAQAGCPDGQYPAAPLIQDTNGIFYGTTPQGGAYGNGTVFSLSLGLGPFVTPQTASGKVGATIQILGTALTGASSVTFNGSPAEFTVNESGSAIAAIVPAGASSGIIQVSTPGGTLSSNVPFGVRP